MDSKLNYKKPEPKTNIEKIYLGFYEKLNIINNDIFTLGEAYMMTGVSKLIDAGAEISDIKKWLSSLLGDNENLRNMYYDLLKDKIKEE